MILYYTERSPFVRKVRMVALHHGIHDQLQLVTAMPADRPADLMAANPLGKIPALRLASGKTLVDSPVISRYLDHIGGNAPLVPADAGAAIEVMHLEALADGILDAAVLMVLESWRPEGNRWPGQFDKQSDTIRRTVIALEQQADFFTLPFSLAHLSAAAAIDYIYHRLPSVGIKEEWLENTPQLAAWFEHFNHSPLMQETAPKEGW